MARSPQALPAASQPRAGFARYALSASVLLWGGAPVATRLLSHRDSAMVLLGFRFVPAALLVGAFMLFNRRGIDVGNQRWPRAVGLSILGGLGYNGLVTFALVVSPATIVGIALTTEPIWILVLEAFRREKGFSLPLLMGFALAALGTAAATAGSPSLGASTVLGVCLAVAATACWALYTVSSSRWETSATDKTALLVASSLPLVLAGLLVIGTGNSSWPHGDPAWLAVATISIGSTVLATAGWNYGAQRIGAKLAAPFLYLQPAATIVLSALLLGERPSGVELAGLAVILLGLAISQYQRA